MANKGDPEEEGAIRERQQQLYDLGLLQEFSQFDFFPKSESPDSHGIKGLTCPSSSSSSGLANAQIHGGKEKNPPKQHSSPVGGRRFGFGVTRMEEQSNHIATVDHRQPPIRLGELSPAAEKKGSTSTGMTASTTTTHEHEDIEDQDRHPDGLGGISTWTEEEETRLVRKLDWCLLPTVWLMALMSWMDRSRYEFPLAPLNQK